FSHVFTKESDSHNLDAKFLSTDALVKKGYVVDKRCFLRLDMQVGASASAEMTIAPGMTVDLTIPSASASYTLTLASSADLTIPSHTLIADLTIPFVSSSSKVKPY
ncbi:hypothetical protein A2U01_0023242, partial [Trifolium medium]|nr:hypothetical protein [Trifolium medium]